jgi:excinuclease ABC subunit A
MPAQIVIRGARVHNLKNIDLEIPRDRLVVITGPSGSGKSSLAFDTLHAEGRRRYLEAIAADAHQLLQQIEKPDVDSIEGLSPTIAIQQNFGVAHSRSTVGTMTHIYDFLRLLFVRAGRLHCPNCGNEIVAQSTEQIVDQLLSLPHGTRLIVLAPLALSSEIKADKLLAEVARQGFSRAMVDGKTVELGGEMSADWSKARQLDVVIDRLIVREGIRTRLVEAVELAGRQGAQVVKVVILEDADYESAVERRFSKAPKCLNCGAAAPEVTMSLLSFNNPEGACPTCNGLGEIPKQAKNVEQTTYACPKCNGTRLKKESRLMRIGGHDISQISSWPVADAMEFFCALEFSGDRVLVGKKVVGEITRRMRVLTHLGLNHLSLDRSSLTLSGGEIQRVRLGTEIGSGMTGVLYVLDEPSRGLHQRDNAQLLDLLKGLREAGNSVIVVEHDPETMRAADYLIDMGPGAGERGGEVVAQGSFAEILADEQSLTGRYLAGELTISTRAARRNGSGKYLLIRNARMHNLKNITVQVPIGALTCVTGVSGAGKSTLVMDVLYEELRRRLHKSKSGKPPAADLVGWENFDRVIGVDQQAIGRTPRSNPATYTGVYDYLRGFFSELPEARVRGYQPERFSFNQKGGRCEACAGDGVRRVEMYLIPDLSVICPVCKGRRYNRETLEVRYKGLSIADVLALTVDEALELLSNIPPIRERLQTLRDVGLGYVRLGQPASTLAGGEAQRVKLARELARKSSGQALYVLDEPTAGLHFEDTKKLLDLLKRLTDSGNTVVVVEHNLDMIKNADYVVDLGPESGVGGGEVVATGTPEEVASVARSFTGQYLRQILASRISLDN